MPNSYYSGYQYIQINLGCIEEKFDNFWILKDGAKTSHSNYVSFEGDVLIFVFVKYD
jgi:hypothetical protein